MCLPAIPMAILAVATTAAKVAQEVSTANSQNKAIGSELQQQNQQVQAQQTASLNDRAMQARAEQGRIQVAAGESGIQLTSGSVEGQLMDSAMQQQLANAAIGANASNQMAANTAEANRYYSDVQKPSIIGAGLQLVAAGVSGYAAGAANPLASAQISKKAASLDTL